MLAVSDKEEKDVDKAPKKRGRPPKMAEKAPEAPKVEPKKVRNLTHEIITIKRGKEAADKMVK